LIQWRPSSAHIQVPWNVPGHVRTGKVPKDYLG
jgi:hypothetical protein